MPQPDAVVTGHLCVDLVPAFGMDRRPRPGTIVEIGPLEMRAGGCVANTGLTLAALGCEVHLDGDVGADPLGDYIVSRLSGHARTTVLIRRATDSATSYSIVADLATRDRAIWHHPGANERFDGRATAVGGARLVHLGYPPILPCLARDGGELALDLLDRARTAGATTSVDFATPDREGASGRVDWAAYLARILPSTDIFSPSLTDLRIALGLGYLGGDDVRRLGASLLAQGAAVVALKAGREGMYLRTGPQERLLAAGKALAPVANRWADQELWFTARSGPVVSTTGAGDAATAGLVYGVLSGLSPAESGRAAVATAATLVGGGQMGPWAMVDAKTGELAHRRFTQRGWIVTAPGVYRPASPGYEPGPRP